MADLYVPDLPEDCDTLTAALAYAAAGWYVLPIRRNARKNPGSVVGKQWQHQSSREPEIIAAWFAGTDHGIALHLGRSGAIAFDVDYPDRMPDVLAGALDLAEPPLQTTRTTGDPARGHYVFAMPAGRMLGNGTGKLGGTWGEIRGRNGIIVVAPSLHDDEAAGGFYKWQRTGPLSGVPDTVGDLLGDAADSEDAATDAEVEAFLAAHTGNTRPELLPGWVTTYRRKIEAGESRHDRMVRVAAGVMKEARAGYIPAQLAADTLHSVFCEAVAQPPMAGTQQRAARNGAQARAEYAGILAWAVAQAHAADLDEIRRRVAEKMPPGPTVLEAGEIYDWFWNARPILRHIHDFARARRCSPWAVLGVTLARVCTAVPPFVVLPALVGGHVSLNTYVGLVGPSGAGKDAATAAARDAIDLSRVSPVETAGVGSGEGIAHQFMTYKKPTNTDAGGLTQYREAVLLTAAEVDTLTALHRRQASTILPELRKAWTGSSLGFAYVDKEKRLTLPEHRYRLCLVVGIQPERAGGILQDTDGGTPATLPVDARHRPRSTRRGTSGARAETGWHLPRWPMATATTGRPDRVCADRPRHHRRRQGRPAPRRRRSPRRPRPTVPAQDRRRAHHPRRPIRDHRPGLGPRRGDRRQIRMDPARGRANPRAKATGGEHRPRQSRRRTVRDRHRSGRRRCHPASRPNRHAQARPRMGHTIRTTPGRHLD